MSQPFQCLFKCPGDNQGKYNILAAASGSSIYCFDIVSEKLLSVWILQQDQEHPLNKKASDADVETLQDAKSDETAHVDSTRPSKRQKVSLGEGSGTDANSLFENDHDLNAELSTAPRSPSAIIKLIGTRNGQYLIAVTDDKCIRVLEFLQDSSLKQLSERYNLAYNSLNIDFGH